ncbi:MAG: uroporphyrinogen-III C-methyltransferase, partial [Phycisphaerae bacterium]|nr:uroporphyrinogen-III C-methyltransferase [Phycisphaerae bacterium]
MSIGTIYIVGAGPGSADLLTIRGLRAIRKADILICDSLLPKTFLDDLGVSLKTKRIEWLANENSRHSQDEINKLMLNMARQGKNVARIKTGDPHVFGRGMEELIFLLKNKVPCEVIPGLTVATAGPCLTDLPLTQREQSPSFAVVTARCAGGKLNGSFPKADSLVVFMGVSVLDKVVDNLINDGWPENCPAALLERIDMPWQNQVKGSLNNIADLAQDASMQSPAILIVGKAAEDNKLSPNRPRILFTGLDPSNFRTMGTILHWPAVKVIRDKKECERLPKIVEQLRNRYFGYAIFTSKISVRIFFEALKDSGYDSRVFHSAKVISCGQGTAMLLEENGIVANHIPGGMGSEAILNNTET